MGDKGGGGRKDRKDGKKHREDRKGGKAEDVMRREAPTQVIEGITTCQRGRGGREIRKMVKNV